MIIPENDVGEVVRKLQPLLTRSECDERPVVLMTCGIAGAGKTTLSKAVLKGHPSFQRLSIDENIASLHGLCNVDYKPEQHEEYSEEADQLFKAQLHELLAAGKADIILDRALCTKEDRDAFKTVVEGAGARWLLVYLKVEPDMLWQRISDRRKKGVDANCALEISEELFDMYVAGFELPVDEGEITVEYTR